MRRFRGGGYCREEEKMEVSISLLSVERAREREVNLSILSCLCCTDGHLFIHIPVLLVFINNVHDFNFLWCGVKYGLTGCEVFKR